MFYMYMVLHVHILLESIVTSAKNMQAMILKSHKSLEAWQS